MFFAAKIVVFMEALQLIAVTLFKSCLDAHSRSVVKAADILLLLVIPLAGVFGHNITTFYAILFVIPLLSIGDPGALARRYVLFLVTFPEFAGAYVIGDVYFGYVSSLTFFNAGSLLALFLTKRRSLKPFRSLDVAVWAIFLVSLLMFARGQEPGGALRSVVTTFLLVIPSYYVVARSIGSHRDASDTALFLVLGGVCNALVGVFESVKHWPLYQELYKVLHVPLSGLNSILSVRAGLLRASGEVANYEVLGLVTGMSLITMLAVRKRFSPSGWWVIVTVLAAGCFVSQSRSAWVATLLGYLLYAGYQRQWGKVGALASAMAIATAALFGLSSSDGYLGQLVGRSGHGQVTTDYRYSLLNRGIEEAIEHPLRGQTLSQLQFSMNDMRQGEHIIDFVNTHILTVLVGGLGAFLCWMVAWLIPFRLAWRLRQGTAIDNAASPIALPFSLMGICLVFLAFMSPIDRVLCLPMVSMGLMSAFARLRSVASAPAVARKVAMPRVEALPRGIVVQA